MSVREEERPWRRSDAVSVEADSITNHEEAYHPAARGAKTTRRRHAADEEFREGDAVVALSQRVADSAASGNWNRQLEQDCSLLHGVLVRCNTRSTAANNSKNSDISARQTEAWKKEARPALERCLLSALAASQRHPSPDELPTAAVAVAPSSNVLLDAVDGLLALDPAIASSLAQNGDPRDTPRLGQRGGPNLLHLVVASSPPAGGRKPDLVRRIFDSVGGRAATRLVESTDHDEQYYHYY